MYASIFQYNLSRPYPYRWFTPVVITAGVMVIVLLSSINFVSSGYVLAPRYSTNPNATMLEARLNGWPSFLISKLQPSCQSTNIPINAKLLTNNTALTYTLNNVFHVATDSNKTSLSSLVYHNNPMHCTPDYAIFLLESIDRNAAQIWQSGWGITAQMYVTCQIESGDSGHTEFQLVAEYDYIPASVSINSGAFKFVGRNQKTRSSLYWGESLLSMYWLKMSNELWNSSFPVDYGLYKGAFIFKPNATSKGNSMGSKFSGLAGFFDVDTRFISFNTSWLQHTYYGPTDKDIGWVTYLTSADILAKVMWSTVLVDLGQRSAAPNILTNATLLQQFTANLTQMYSVRDEVKKKYKIGGPAIQPYNVSDDRNGPLGTNPSVFAATYLCQVPQRKPTGSLILAVLVADLVMFQALWLLFKLGMSMYMVRIDNTTNMCAGCLEREGLLIKQSPVPGHRGLERDCKSNSHGYNKLPTDSESPYTVQSH